MPSLSRHLSYGRSHAIDLDLPTGLVRASHYAPESLADVAAAAEAAMTDPLDFPALREAIVPGDRVVLALQPNVPFAATLVAGVLAVLDERGVSPEDVTILQSPRLDGRPEPDPRRELSPEAAAAVTWHIHDATGEDEFAYLASSSTGERLYLNKRLVEADLVLPIGLVEYDAVLGYQGTSGGLFPTLSNVEAIRRHAVVGHAELTPDDARTARQAADEVGWLLGTQFCLQGVRGQGGGLSAVLGGLGDAVLAEGKRLLREGWRLEPHGRVDLVLATVDSGPAGTTWSDITTAAAAAAGLVERGGRIVLLSDWDAGDRTDGPGDAERVLRESATLEEAREVLPQVQSPDQPAMLQLLAVLERATVYVRSAASSDVLEPLFLETLADDGETQRLLMTADSLAILEGGQHVQTRIVA